MEVGDKVKIIGKSRGQIFKNESFQRHYQNCEYGIISNIGKTCIDVRLQTKDYGEQTWEFKKQDLIPYNQSESQPQYEIY